MLAKDSFLRNLPGALNREQRLQFEAIVYSTDVIKYDFDRLREITGSRGNDIGERADRAGLFTYAWSIVDQVHVVRQLLQTISAEIEKKDGIIFDFWKKYECATLLRNKMDHLNNQIPNLAKTKKMQHPIFGSLSYFLVLPTDIQQKGSKPTIRSGQIVVISAGKVSLDAQLFAMPNPAGRPIRAPVSQFQFSAFDQVFELEECVAELESVLKVLETRIYESLLAAATKAATEVGDTVAVLMKPSGGEIVMKLEFSFGADIDKKQNNQNPQ